MLLLPLQLKVQHKLIYTTTCAIVPVAATRAISLVPSCEGHSEALGSETQVSRFSVDIELQWTTSETPYVASPDAVQQPTGENSKY